MTETLILGEFFSAFPPPVTHHRVGERIQSPCIGFFASLKEEFFCLHFLAFSEEQL
jgi:hypothetical protein